VNSGTWRIVIIVALVVTGVAVLANGFADQGAAVAQTAPSGLPTSTGSAAPTQTDTPTDEPTPTETPEPETRGVLIKVFNGTDATGLAGEVQVLLEGDGYVAPEDAADAPIKGVKRTIVDYRGGDNEEQGRANAQYVSKTYFNNDARVEVLSAAYEDEVTNPVQLAIVVGEDYAATAAV
jgi:hypothetical protein